MNHNFDLELKIKSLRGITDVNKCHFYPSYSFRKATFGPKGIKPIKTKLRGSKKGKKLDSQINDYFRFGIQTTLPELKVVIREINKRNWTIVACQLPVRQSDIRLATSLDMVCFDGTTYFIIELKTGYQHYMHRYTLDRMNIPFTDMTDCPLNQHRLQMFVAHNLFVKTYPFKIVTSYLWYVNGTGVTEYDQTLDCWETCRDIFKSSKDETRKDRTKLKRKATSKLNKKRQTNKRRRKKLKVKSEK